MNGTMSANYLVLPIPSAQSGGSGMTISFWMWSPLTLQGAVIGLRNTARTQFGLNVLISYDVAASSAWVNIKTGYAYGVWDVNQLWQLDALRPYAWNKYTISVTFDHRVSFYLNDGTVIAEEFVTNRGFNGREELVIGGSPDGLTAFDGYISNVRVYDIATDPEHVASSFLAEIKPQSALCPTSDWIFYRDSEGIEGHDSCLFVNYTPAVQPVAKASCPVGSHLVTTRSYGKSSGLAGLLSVLATHIQTPFFIGAQQAPSAVHRGLGWSWIDGTDAGNLNCNSVGCLLWLAGEPNEFPSGVSNTTLDQHTEDCATIKPVGFDGLVLDANCTKSYLSVCEVDLVSRTHTSYLLAALPAVLGHCSFNATLFCRNAKRNVFTLAITDCDRHQYHNQLD